MCDLISKFTILLQWISQLILQVLDLTLIILVQLFKLVAPVLHMRDVRYFILHFLAHIWESLLELISLISNVVEFTTKLIKCLLVVILHGMVLISQVLHLCLHFLYLTLLRLHVGEKSIELLGEMLHKWSYIPITLTIDEWCLILSWHISLQILCVICQFVLLEN